MVEPIVHSTLGHEWATESCLHGQREGWREGAALLGARRGDSTRPPPYRALRSATGRLLLRQRWRPARFRPLRSLEAAEFLVTGTPSYAADIRRHLSAASVSLSVQKGGYGLV